MIVAAEEANRTREICLTILTDRTFVALSVVFYLCVVAVSLLQVLYIAFLRYDKFFAPEAKSLLLSNCVYSSLSCCSFFVRHTYVLSIYLNQNILFLNSAVCVILGSTTFLGLFAEASVTLVVAVVLIHKTKRAASTPIRASLLHGSVLVLSMIFAVTHAFVNYFQLEVETEAICYCNPVSAFYYYTSIPSGALLVLYTTSIALLSFTYVKTRQRILDQTINTAQHTLWERTKLYNLYYTLTNVLPAFSINGMILCAIQVAFTFLARDYYKGSNIANVQELLVCATLVVVSRCLLMQLLIVRNEYLSNELKNLYPKLYKTLFFYKGRGCKGSSAIVPMSIVDCPALEMLTKDEEARAYADAAQECKPEPGNKNQLQHNEDETS